MNEDIIFKGIVGSHAYGTNTPKSDIDIKGVYNASMIDVMGFNYKKQIEVSKDEVYYELKRFIELAVKANPTILEMLYLPEDKIIFQSEAWLELKKHRHIFLTKKCAQTYAGYAVSQLRKAKGLNKMINWEKQKVERKTPLDFCYVYEREKTQKLSDRFIEWELACSGVTKCQNGKGMYCLYTDPDNIFDFRGLIKADSNALRLTSIPKAWFDEYDPSDEYSFIFHYDQDAYQSHCKDYWQYQEWLKTRNTDRYVQTSDGIIDGKNMMHCVRLIETAIDIAKHGEVRVHRKNADELLKIRNGEHDLNKLIEISEKMLEEVDYMFNKSDLPEEVDLKLVEQLILDIRFKDQMYV